MSLVTAREVAKALAIHKLGFLGVFVGWLFLKITRITTINTHYKAHKDKGPRDFCEEVLQHYGVHYEIPEKDLKRIPKEGAFITVSNHPLGLVDGVILMKTLLEYRQDSKVMTNFLLHRVVPMASHIIPVNPFENHKKASSSIPGIKEALRHLKSGGGLGIFPAGEVSVRRDEGRIEDKAWEPSIMKLIQKAEVPIIPIYFHARNSHLFYYLSSWSGVLRTLKLPSEIFTQKKRVIKVRIGRPITTKDQQEFVTLDGFTNFVRTKTYMLSNSYDKKRLSDVLPKNLRRTKMPTEIVLASKNEEILAELEFCRLQDKRLLESKQYEVFLAQKKDIPYVVHEIGRLREITFRAIGEGTNKSIDLDTFDEYYHHMFLWDKQANCLAGAYRMGMGQQIFKEYGIDGFYLQDLFRFEPELHKMMQESIEMGRAFIVEAYQQRPLPLFLLWKGIVHCTLRFPEHNYLIGGVTISDKFSDFSKSLMIEFMKSHFYDPYVAQFVHPRKEYKVKLKDADKDFVFDESKSDLNKFDKIIDELEPAAIRMPVLLKKYLKQNAKVMAFNVDPLFNNAIDGLMYIRIADLPESTVKPVLEEFQAALEAKSAAEKPLETP